MKICYFSQANSEQSAGGALQDFRSKVYKKCGLRVRAMSCLLPALLLNLLLTGCVIFSQEKNQYVGLEFPKPFKPIMALIQQGRTTDALAKINHYLYKTENIHWHGYAYFLKAFVFEKEGKYKKAIEFYRRAVSHGAVYASRLEAKALYRLSFVYEKSDRRRELLTSLLELKQRPQFFHKLTTEVETPARLAATYASLGKVEEGRMFHQQAARNYHQLRRGQSFESSLQRLALARALYYLGYCVMDEAQESLQSLMDKLAVGQKYFLASAGASQSQWSQKSRDRIEREYNRVWMRVMNFSPRGFDHDPLAHKKHKHGQQLIMASNFYDLIHQLRVEDFPAGGVNAYAQSIMESSARWLNQVENFVQKLELGPETVRSKKIKNKKLARFIEEKVEEALVNTELNKKQKQKHNKQKQKHNKEKEQHNKEKEQKKEKENESAQSHKSEQKLPQPPKRTKQSRQTKQQPQQNKSQQKHEIGKDPNL